MTLRIQQQQAFVLHTRPYRETSLLLDLLTLDHGRISAVARSARGMRSRFRGILQAFTPLIVDWTGQGELMNLTAAEMNGSPYHLQNNILLTGLYVNELVMRLMQRWDPHPALFCLYQSTLEKLSRVTNPQPVLRIFEKYLLGELGYGLVLNKEAGTQASIVADHYYRYVPEHGVVQVSKESAQLPKVFSGKSLLALHADNFADEQVMRDAKRFMRIALEAHLGGKPLKSRELFIKM